jgi:deoxyribose-phosphate aldolase
MASMMVYGGVAVLRTGPGREGGTMSPRVEILSAGQIAQLIDHTMLKADATAQQIARLCQEALDHEFAAVCIQPCRIPVAVPILTRTPVKVDTVVGFPLGATLPGVKVYEAEQAILAGAQEVDMVINVGALKDGEDRFAESDIAEVVQACHQGGALCKVIIEAALLTEEEKGRACRLVQAAGADFVKTSTGFGPGGATVEDVALMRSTVGPEMGIKAAGGIRGYETALAMIRAGATRIGASAGIAIVQEARRALGEN